MVSNHIHLAHDRHPGAIEAVQYYQRVTGRTTTAQAAKDVIALGIAAFVRMEHDRMLSKLPASLRDLSDSGPAITTDDTASGEGLCDIPPASVAAVAGELRRVG